MKKVCFIVAMQGEAKPLIRHFGLHHIEGCFGSLPPQAYRASYAGKEIFLVTNGIEQETGLDYIGCEAAVLSAHLAVSSFSPDLIINAGTAGGFVSKGAEIGDVYLSNKYVVFHDRRVPIPGWDKMGQGYLPCVDPLNIISEINTKSGVCTSGSSLDITGDDLEQMKQTGGEVKDMEAGAVAWVASLYNIPLLCVKAITDLVDAGHSTPEQFNDNFLLATQRLDDVCFRLIDEKLVDKL